MLILILIVIINFTIITESPCIIFMIDKLHHYNKLSKNIYLNDKIIKNYIFLLMINYIISCPKIYITNH